MATASTAASTIAVRPGPWVRSAASIACTIKRAGIRSSATASLIASSKPRPCELAARSAPGPARRPRNDGPSPGGLAGLGADRVDDHGECGPGPGLDQPSGLADRDHQADARRRQVTQPGDDRGSGAVITAELVADADHYDQGADLRRREVGRRNGNHRPFGLMRIFLR